MKALFTLLLVIASYAVSAQKELLVGRWKFSEPGDSTLSEAERTTLIGMMAPMSFQFENNGNYIGEFYSKETGTYEFDETAKLVTLTNTQGEINKITIIDLTSDRLRFRFGNNDVVMVPGMPEASVPDNDPAVAVVVEEAEQPETVETATEEATMSAVTAEVGGDAALTAEVKPAVDLRKYSPPVAANAGAVAASYDAIAKKWHLYKKEVPGKSARQLKAANDLLKGSYFDIKENGTYTQEVIGLRLSGTWKFNKDGTMVIMEAEGSNNNWHIVQISGNELVLARGTSGERYHFRLKP